MNPKTPQDLDPKLKEAYERVMGTNVKPAPAEGPKIMPPAPPPPEKPAENAPVIPTAATFPHVDAPTPTYTVPNLQPAETKKKKAKISPVIFLVIGIAFFVIYAVVWAKIFGIF